MARLLILLLVLAVPLKAWASVALPHASAIGHIGSLTLQPVDHTAHSHGDQPAETGEHASCAVHGAGVQSNDCPHLVMPLLFAAPLAHADGPGAVEPPIAAARRLGSVVLDVLLPPPLFLL